MRKLILAVCLAALTTGCNSSLERVKAASVKPVDKRNNAPDFTLKDSNGKTMKLSDYKGKVVLLNFWATWCGPCRIEIPWFMDFEQKFKDRGFAVIGVAMDDEGWEVVKPYIEKMKVNYRIVVGDEMTAARYGGIDAMPSTFIIDREGKIASVHLGLVSKSIYEHDIEQLLQ